MKKWYQSRLVWLGALTILASVLTASLEGLGWREISISLIGTLIVMLRADTSKRLR